MDCCHRALFFSCYNYILLYCFSPRLFSCNNYILLCCLSLRRAVIRCILYHDLVYHQVLILYLELLLFFFPRKLTLLAIRNQDLYIEKKFKDATKYVKEKGREGDEGGEHGAGWRSMFVSRRLCSYIFLLQ